MGSDDNLLLLVTFYVEGCRSLMTALCQINTENMDDDDILEIKRGHINNAFYEAVPTWWATDSVYKNPVKVEMIDLVEVDSFNKSEKEEKPKNWFGMGYPVDFPPVGTMVRSVNHQGEDPVLACWTSMKGEKLVCWNNGKSDYNGTPLEFIRPAKTEREKLVEKALDDANADIDCMDIIVENLVDAGWRPKE